MTVHVQNVFKTIKGVDVLLDASLDAHPGRVTGFAGVNGSGKTMLMRIIAGLVRPTSGTVSIDGKLLGSEIPFPPSIGMLLENPAFLPGRSGLDNLALLASITGRIDREQAAQVIAYVGLDPHDRRAYKKYSLGMRQRLGIAAAVMEEPDIVMLDEPTNALDPSGVRMVQRLIARERARGATVILSCHDAAVLHGLADEIYLFAEGHICGHQILRERAS